ncbi:hypothetical protein [Vitiosangium sp. GDMCC 1.1324]|uniref:hypothetical protein n=1 Tax=Vitiosangium sp. (strain GDMCC 1.1324) TaxID=2138576 RepID=UPI000D3A3C70|nr:hypothetical protein [Vitiosangium sp. GDMCC 1.1324]PTL82830.1 hypothetical protein DAT35_18905 [Vitiosangium sp. GDMCC 1.1324]
MMTSSPTAALPSPSASPAGSLSFRGLWLFSPRQDALLLLVPLTFTLLTWIAATLLAPPVSGSANRMAIWTAQYLLGNGTHVVLTFLLFAVHRDVLRAEPRQPLQILLGSLGMLGVGALLFALYYVDSTGYAYVVGVLFNVFGLHHILSQCKGFWALHTLRGSQAGLAAPVPLERRLQLLFVPVMLTLVLVRLFFVAESSLPGDTPYLDIHQGTPLPHGALAVLLLVWLGYFGLLFRTLLRSGAASGPKVLYLLTVAVATGLTLVAPAWGNVMLPGLHGLEYYLLSARMMEPREGDPPSRVSRAWVWPLMVLSMLPLLALGVVHLVIAGPAHGTVSAAATDLKSHVVLRGLTTLSLGVVLAHYFADALIYRFRLPSIRRVMMRRLGFSS